MPLSDYSKNRLMNSLFQSSVFVSLHSGDPLKDGKELSGGEYSRQEAESFTVAQKGQRSSNGSVAFEGLPSATITHIGIWDQKNDGNLIWSAALLAPKTVYEGDAIKFKSGKIILGLE